MKTLVSMQDLSCLGKCSLTVIHPTVSAMGVQCAVLPTALLSTHTAFPGPAVTDLSHCARPILEHWATIGAEFDGILTGYLASPDQVFGGETKVVEQRFCRATRAEAVHRDNFACCACVLIPTIRRACLYANSCLHASRQHAFLIVRRLLFKFFKAGHRNHSCVHAFFFEHSLCFHASFHFRTACNEQHVGRAVAVF